MGTAGREKQMKLTKYKKTEPFFRMSISFSCAAVLPVLGLTLPNQVNEERKVAEARNRVDQIESMSLVSTVVERKEAPYSETRQIEVWP